MNFAVVLAQQYQLAVQHVENVIRLIDEGNTIPFIARYRKEMTGAMDDQLLRELAERLAYLRSLEKRREEVIAAVEGMEKMTDELRGKIEKAQTLAEIEDLYRPYRPKRRTRATIAKEKGLEPLAAYILAQRAHDDPEAEALRYLDGEKGVQTAQEAIAGAQDIIAEVISDDAEMRKKLRALAEAGGVLKAAGDAEKDSVYATYYAFSEFVKKLTSHKILAINRGEKEGFLKVCIELPEQTAVRILCGAYVKGSGSASKIVEAAARDAFDRLIAPAIEREIRAALTESAAEQAIRVFGLNLGQLLMQPPIKGKTVLALDPAYRTGCKVAVVDETGRVLDVDVVYPTPPQNKVEEAERRLSALIRRHGVQVISIGNGTASKETEIFTANLIAKLPDMQLSYMMVNEAGASVYSASKLAAQEFPEYDVSQRSAVSIARRLQDPLAELVKIDPKSIGVGQYQHDMPPARLDEALKGVVENCVNRVGVDLNTASPALLSYVAGLNAAVAKNIVAYREENGSFTKREQLKKVAKLGPKAYQQCAGFLRIPGAKNILDNTGVHPESYDAAKKLLELCGYTLDDVKNRNLAELSERIKQAGEERAAEYACVGAMTLGDIVAELKKPGRDLRDELPQPMLRTDVMDLNDLKPGMEMKGTVRNVVDFGAFVDIGVHQDGLVHISQICSRFIRHPSEAVKVGDVVTCWVLEVDRAKKRISLTMKKPKTID